MLKKVLLVTFVVATFIIYSVHQRSDNNASAGKLTSNPQPTQAASSGTTVPATTPTSYKDGRYTGKAADALYGYIQVRATVSNGKLSDVEFLQYPNDRRNSVEINSQAMPLLKQQALQVQTAQVDGVSGATDTSQAFIESLSDALIQARA